MAVNGGAGESGARSGLPFRDALADIADVVCDVVASGRTGPLPRVTIAIPTFRRLDLLVQAVASALGQRFDQPFEIIVLDNDPASTIAAELVERLPGLLAVDFRYLVNRNNAGMYGNHNLCIREARGEWLTILHDDDLLEENFLETLFGALDADPQLDGIVPAKRFFDERPKVEAALSPHATALLQEKMSPRVAMRYLLSNGAARRELVGRAATKLLVRSLYRTGPVRRIEASGLFWAPLTGNIVGFLFRRRDAVAIGGFYPEEAPSADDRFYVRFAGRYRLALHQAQLARIRIAQNETLKVATVQTALGQKLELHRLMAGHEVPRWYLRFSPLIMKRLWTEYSLFWRTEVPTDELEETLGMRLPDDCPRFLAFCRAILRGF